MSYKKLSDNVSMESKSSSGHEVEVWRGQAITALAFNEGGTVLASGGEDTLVQAFLLPDLLAASRPPSPPSPLHSWCAPSLPPPLSTPGALPLFPLPTPLLVFSLPLRPSLSTTGVPRPHLLGPPSSVPLFSRASRPALTSCSDVSVTFLICEYKCRQGALCTFDTRHLLTSGALTRQFSSLRSVMRHFFTSGYRHWQSVYRSLPLCSIS